MGRLKNQQSKYLAYYALDDSDQPPSKRIVLTNPTKICRDKYANLVFNRKEEKQYRVIYDKRVILKDLDTLPYGH